MPAGRHRFSSYRWGYKVIDSGDPRDLRSGSKLLSRGDSKDRHHLLALASKDNFMCPIDDESLIRAAARRAQAEDCQ